MSLSKPLLRAEKGERLNDQLTKSKNIAAIDFGTSSVSLAYTTPFYNEEVKVLKLHSTYERIPNAILIRKDGEECSVVDVGHDAQTTYSKLGARNIQQYLYFERIKLLLEKDTVSNA